MKVVNKSEFPVTDEACKKATCKTLKQWYAELDKIDGLKKGRRACTKHVYSIHKDPWWSVTIGVEYENHHGVIKKDGRPEGYTICATKTIKAPVPAVYESWTKAGKFAEMFGDDGEQSVKEDGKIKCKAGCKGTFVRIRPNKDLRFTWEHKGCTEAMQVDVQFQDNKGKCLIECHDVPNSDPGRSRWIAKRLGGSAEPVEGHV